MGNKREKVIVHQASKLLKSGYPREKLIDDFVRVNRETWGDLVPEKYIWTLEKISSQLNTCPDLLYCGFVNERMVGTLSMMLIHESIAKGSKSWEKTTANGTLQSHDPTGDCIFGADLSVSPNYQGMAVAEAIMDKAFLLSVVLSNRKGSFLGSRIPRYHKLANRMSVEDYVFGEKRDGKTRDPEIRLYQSEGFQLIKIIPDYMEDPESLNYGVLMFWPNPYYGKIPLIIRKLGLFFLSK